MKIAIDIDDVLCNFFEGYFDFHKNVYSGLKVSELDNEYVWEVFDISKEKVLMLGDEYCLSKEFDEVNLVEGSFDGLNFLKSLHDIIFVTSRPCFFQEKLVSFLKERFSFINPSLFFSGNIRGGGKCKGDICLEEGVDLIIEDSSNNSLKCAEKGVNVLLLDKPWNQYCEHERIVRCGDWKEVLEKIKNNENG